MLPFLVLLAAPLAASGSPRIDVFVSVGTTDGVEVRGRAYDDGGASPARGRDRVQRLGKNLSRLFSDDLEERPVEIALGDTVQRVETDDEGRFTARFAGVAAGVHRARVRLVGAGTTATGKVVVAATGAPMVVSDLDDTVFVTNVTDKSRLLEAALLEDGRTQPKVPGMPELLVCLRRGAGGGLPEATVHYLSGSPLSYYGRITDFLAGSGAPLGEVWLRNYGLGSDDDPLDPIAYKLSKAPALLAGRPNARVVLVGDSGEKDPEVYRELAARFPGRIAATYIRLAEGGANADSARFGGQVAFQNPLDAATDARARGLVDERCIAEVAAAQH